MNDNHNNGWKRFAEEIVKRSTSLDKPLIYFGFEDESQLSYFKDNGFYVEGTSSDAEAVDRAKKSGITSYNAGIDDLRVLQNGLFPSGFCTSLGEYSGDVAQRALSEMARVCSRNLYLEIPSELVGESNADLLTLRIYQGWLEQQLGSIGAFEKIELGSRWNPFSHDRFLNYAIRLNSVPKPKALVLA